jgi:hypothetical protein
VVTCALPSTVCNLHFCKVAIINLKCTLSLIFSNSGLTKGVADVFKGKLQGSPQKKKPKMESSKLKEPVESKDLAAIGGRDAPEDFFYMISKALYAKSKLNCIFLIIFFNFL